MQISLTTFSDFVVATPAGRIGCVRKALQQEKTSYQPAQDYWKPLREAIVDAHKGAGGRRELEALDPPGDPKKVGNYEACRVAYLRWLGRQDLVWTGGKGCTWSSGDLEVRINPELFVTIRDQGHAIKLYFRADKLSKAKADPVLRLLERTHGQQGRRTVAILDVPRGKLLTPTRDIPGIDALLEGEAAAFVAMWGRLNGDS